LPSIIDEDPESVELLFEVSSNVNVQAEGGSLNIQINTEETIEDSYTIVM